MSLVNRKALNTTVKKEYIEYFDSLAKDTRIPKSKLMDEALECLFTKYGKEFKASERA